MSSAVGSRPAEPWDIQELISTKTRQMRIEHSARQSRRAGRAGAFTYDVER